jgi:probable HAF family extracellular repeat protein
MSRINFGVWAAMVLILVPLAGAQSYTVTDLGVLPTGNSSSANAVNIHGAVTGWASTNSGGSLNDHAFLWTATGGMQDLGTLDGDDQSFGYGINNAGNVAGVSASTITGVYHAFLWTKQGGMQDLGNLGGSNGAWADGINDSGAIVGWSYLSNNITEQPFLWTKTGGMANLGSLGGLYSVASGINNLGQVVGYSDLPKGTFVPNAFLWTQASGMQDLGTLGGSENSGAAAISDSGVVVGSSWSEAEITAFVWTKKQGMRMIGAGNGGQALGVNDSGTVVGSFQGPPQAFVWSPTHPVQNLNALIPPGSGWVLTYAQGINQSGQIAAIGTINGETHAALLTPTN